MGNVVNSVLFPAPIPSYTYGSIPSPPLHTIDGVPCLYYTNRNPTSGFLVYLHGNNSDLGRIRKPLFTWARDSNYTVIAVEYPGYGVNYGSTTPENCIHAALKVLRFARLQAQMAGVPVALVGRSIGSGIASQIAARHPNLLDYLILISPFESIERMAESRIGWMSFTLHDTLNSGKSVEEVPEADTDFTRGVGHVHTSGSRRGAVQWVWERAQNAPNARIVQSRCFGLDRYSRFV